MNHYVTIVSPAYVADHHDDLLKAVVLLGEMLGPTKTGPPDFLYCRVASGRARRMNRLMLDTLPHLGQPLGSGGLSGGFSSSIRICAPRPCPPQVEHGPLTPKRRSSLRIRPFRLIVPPSRRAWLRAVRCAR